mmetsp:Transcript_12834/g.32339  ORF Transcript_12834/g.32339 Transcript_12834/m.32339 type:complete len:149 (+) Transcript_12834:1820-2266(+)|eukprot:CAMPEP_0116085772 /NCGR_PEP_ID=MMETSP0327-20121206/4499_1 /TAXON_ID=44447 /ORGANISM="Pseudo-nitzschia delicatissima, Strain B596" /LENGTH=148 /DNA_ID=CAMNT_0003576777 /DNA_START=1813 /DNA_END=2259 /DNA_ORIENTATION=-
MYYHRVIIYFDGASRNNPHGPAGCGWVMYEMDSHGADGGFIASGNQYLGYDVSNNQAEYGGLEKALRYMLEDGINCHGLYIRGDSQIVINQLDGIYEVRSNNIIPHFNQVGDLLDEIDCQFVKYTHICRSRNGYADSLANEAIDDNHY